MEYVQGVGYEVEFSDHARVMLAFRYGIALECSRNTVYFSRMVPNPSVADNRFACRFHLNGRAIDAVLADHKVVTVFPVKQRAKSDDASRIATGFDIVCAVSPDIFPLADIVVWREEYLAANGALNVDNLRREIRYRSKTFLEKRERLMVAEPGGRYEPTVHDVSLDITKCIDPHPESVQMESFYGEVQEIRERLVSLEAQTIDFSSKESIEDAAYYSKLAKIAQTLTSIEASPPSPEESKEILHTDYRESQKEFNAFLMEQPRFQAYFGLAEKGKYIDTNSSNRRIFYHPSSVVVDVMSSDDPADPWHEIVFMDEGSNYFFMTTKIKKYIDSYKIGDVGIWSIEYGSIRYLHPRPQI